MYDRITETEFWARVDRRGPNDCWPWLGVKTDRGYPKVVHHLATHYALIFDGRPRVADLSALHACDNPSCVNPAHLRWGTHADNMRDKVERGRCRTASREKMHNLKATDEVLRVIASSTESTNKLARRLGVSQYLVWRHRTAMGIRFPVGRRPKGKKAEELRST